MLINAVIFLLLARFLALAVSQSFQMRKEGEED